MKRNKPKATVAKPTLYLMYLLLGLLFVVSAVLVYGIIAENMYLSEWQRKIDNHEVIKTKAKVTHLEITNHLLVTGRRGSTTNIENCSFTYVYTVDGVTYHATETYPNNGESLCFRTEVKEINIYYDPQDHAKSISEKMGHEGLGN